VSPPPLALSMGDPAGIGPEICAKALAADGRAAGVVVVGDAGLMQTEVGRLGLGVGTHAIDRVADRRGSADVIDVLAVTALDAVEAGQVSATAGRAACSYIEQAVALTTAGELRALVTAPINKEALSLAGVPYPGHTEMLAALAGVEHVTMMLYNPELRVVLVSAHVSLREAIERLDMASELRAIRAAAGAGAAFGIARPRIGVAGLNPHASEGGLFGDEEALVIAPAIAAARADGLDATGPWPGDTVFMRARTGEFDLVVAQYHDQGLIPVKYLGLESGVNVTLGLPFVRTSPDHGTAFAIAGQGIAEASSLIVAIDAADRMSGGGDPPP
jgi:4-phospho-D-threonate 3-dehydrogenase / 4-phospho-D-erythronate 3-dehydrogenase